MNHKIAEQEWLKEFKDFLDVKEVEVPQDLSKKILKDIYRNLNPSSWIVFLKLLAVHSIVGTFSLAICDQFGMSPFNTGLSLSAYFMKFGYSACMISCGFIFLSLTILLSKNILRREEFLVLKNNILLQVFFLSLLSLVSFAAFGANVILGAAVLWFIGAFLGGFITAHVIDMKIYLADIL